MLQQIFDTQKIIERKIRQAELLTVKNSNGTKFKNEKLASGCCDILRFYKGT